ncbi:hypothetical protein GPECTOR_3g171 [Gonium pectorale]|uniref:RMT2 domain-containing protein n=1 Tax=Gonium pectorale TaxID=33097 RepID=A0A150GZG5_GONPE|nr:hypothetical protein GPECTOR_3g171 [Gonium pectorale]|eukprot:KXZ55008.1 hypothetical protein GPECTOR_3g171 [Gonium pectorale]
MTEIANGASGEALAVPSLEQQLLQAAATGDAEEVARLIELEADVDYQDEDGVSPLMKAAEGGHTAAMAALLQAGAPWNAQDRHGYCAGEYAMGNGQQEAVDVLLDFAVQAELVLGALQRRMQVGAPSSAAANSDYLQQKLVYRGEQLLDADGEAVMMGWERPLMLRHAELICPGARQQQEPAGQQQEQQGEGAPEPSGREEDSSTGPASTSAAEQRTAGLPEASGREASALRAGRGGGHVLNVGFGLGIIDTAIQSHHPARHTIVEAHPDVLEHMARLGWPERPGVRILRGRWQDVLPELLDGGPYDGIFFDTYGEYYEEMREFHSHLPRLLARDGIYSFFNGLALISLELAAKGLIVDYEPLEVGSLGDDVWQGVRSKYWHFETYFLPRVTFDDPLEPVAEASTEGQDGPSGEGQEAGEEEGKGE